MFTDDRHRSGTKPPWFPEPVVQHRNERHLVYPENRHRSGSEPSRFPETVTTGIHFPRRSHEFQKAQRRRKTEISQSRDPGWPKAVGTAEYRRSAVIPEKRIVNHSRREVVEIQHVAPHPVMDQHTA